MSVLPRFVTERPYITQSSTMMIKALSQSKQNDFSGARIQTIHPNLKPNLLFKVRKNNHRRINVFNQ